MHSTKRHVPSSKCLENEDGTRQAAPRGEGKLSRKITGLIPEPGGQVCMSVLQIKYILQCWRSFSKHYCGVHHIHISLFAFIPGAGQEDWYRSRVSGVETWGKLNIKYFDKLQSRLKSILPHHRGLSCVLLVWVCFSRFWLAPLVTDTLVTEIPAAGFQHLVERLKSEGGYSSRLKCMALGHIWI